MTNKDKQLSLSIKTDENTKAIPLGIKSSVEGIKHFTNWNNIVNSIGETGDRLRRDDQVYNNLKFKTKRYTDGAIRNGGDHDVYQFDDKWSVNKIKILDDLAFVAEDEYSHVEKATKTLNTKAYQYFVERDFVGVLDNDDNAGDDTGSSGPIIITPGSASWTSTGAYTGHMPFPPGTGYSAGPYSGSFAIKYTPSTNTWEISGSIPGTGGWGGAFSGSAIYDACSGGGATNLDVTISGSHYCTASFATETYSGTVRLNISPGSGDELACSTAITINSVSWGTPSQYASGGGCYISYSASGLTYGGYISPVYGDTPDPPPYINRSITIQRRIGSLTVQTELPELSNYGNLAGGKHMTPLASDFEHLYIRLNSVDLADHYLKFGGFVYNDFGKSNIYTRDAEQEAENGREDLYTLGGIDFKSKNVNPNRKLKEKNLGTFDSMGSFVPPGFGQDNPNYPPVNYSQIQAPAYPIWKGIPSRTQDEAVWQKWFDAVKNFGWTGKGQLFENGSGVFNLKPEIIFGGQAWADGRNLLGDPTPHAGVDPNVTVPLIKGLSPNAQRTIPTQLDEVQDVKFQPAIMDLGKFSPVHQGGFKNESPDTAILPDITFGPKGFSANSEGSFGGYYYLIYDVGEEDSDQPKIVGIQFDQVLNSISGDSIEQEAVGTDANNQARLIKSNIDVSLDFVKILPVRKCGKVDIYKRKSGIVQTVDRYGRIVSTGHGLQDGDTIEISGALYETPSTGTGDIHPLNNRFSIEVITENMFLILDAPSSSDLNNLDGDMRWRSFSNNLTGKILEGWSYQGTMFSPTGKNGYFQNLNQNESQLGDPQNRVATESEFFTSERIDISNIESGFLDITDDNTDEYAIRDLVNLIPEASQDMSLFPKVSHYYANINYGTSASQIYPYITPDDPFNRKIENYLGSRFGCDIDVEFSNDSGSSRIYTIAIGERGSDVSVDLFGLEDNLCYANDEVLYFSDSKRVIPQYLPYGKTHVVNIRVDQYNNITSVDHRDTLFGGGNGIVQGKQPRGNDLLDQTERNPWTDFENILRQRNNHHAKTSQISLSEILQYEEQYLGNYLNPRGTGSRSRWFKSGYWERHAVVHWYNQNIPRIYSFRGGQVDERFLDPIERDFGEMSRPILEQDDDQNILSYFGDQTGAQTIDRFNSAKKARPWERGYWSIFPWVDSYGKAVSIRKLENMHELVKNVGIAVLSASTSKVNRTFRLDQTELPATSYPKGKDGSTSRERYENIQINKKSAQIGQLNLVYLQTNFGVSYNQSGYTQICAGGANGYATRDFSFANEFSSGFTGTYAGDNIAEVMASCHLSYSNVVLEKDRILFSEQAIAENKSIIYVLGFTPSEVDPIGVTSVYHRSKNHTISRDFNFPRNSRLIDSATSDNIFNVGDGFGSSFKVDKNLLLTNATDVIDEFGQLIPSPRGTSSNVTSGVAYGVDQIFVYEKLRDSNYDVFEFSQKITASTKQKVSENYTDRRLTLIDDLTVPLAAMNYENKPNGTYAWNIRLAGRYDIADTKIVLQDPQSVAVFDRDFSEYKPMIGNLFTTTPQSTSAKIENFSHQDTSVLTYEDATGNTSYPCRINIADYQKLRGQYYSLPEQTPVLNYSLDGDEDLYISSMTVSFNLRDVISDISTTYTSKLGVTPLVPRVVLYSRDPQKLVTRNRSTDLASGISKFYSLDDTRKSKKRGAYIAPESAETSDLFAQYNTGFMGQHRGGAQDLFFYGTLEDSIPRTAQEVFAGDVPRSTLPYTYGGEKNLADFDSGCSWIAPDVYHKFSDEEINQIKPYAKIFNPTLQTDGTYSVTITSDDLDFDDYIEKTSGIWIGFVLTNVNSFDINTSKITYQELAKGEIKDNSDISYNPIDDFSYSNNMDDNIGPYKYILPSTIDGLSDGSMDMSRWVNARYPYCRVGVYPSVDSQGSRTAIRNTKGKSPVAKSLSCFAEATVVNPTVEISGFVTEGRRYKTSFSKNAIIDLKDGYTQKWFDGDSDAVVTISNSRTSSNSSDFNKGIAGESYQIMSSTFGAVSSDQINPLDGYAYGATKPANIISSFDIEQPEFVSLLVYGEQVSRDIATLFTPAPFDVSASGVNLTFSPVKETKARQFSLFTGQRDFHGTEPLFLKSDIAENNFTLNIHEIQPSAIVPLMVNVIDASGGINLNFAPPTTGSSPLFTQGPFTNSGITTLTAIGSLFSDEGASLVASGAFKSSGLAPLHTVASITENNPITLAMNLPQSGSTPLYIRKDFDASGQVPLTIFDKAPHSGNLNLFTGTQFDVDNKDLSIFIDVPNIATGQTPLQIDGFALTANSNRNSNASFISKFSDGEFDKGDVDGNFNEDLISKTSPSKTVLSNSVLGNAVNENFYDRNRNLVLDKNLPLQTDSNYSSTFVSQKFVGNTPSPNKNKKGTSDPAWNLAFGKRTRNSTVLGDDIRISRIGVNNRYIIKKFYTNDTYNNKDRFKPLDGAIDFTEKEFYDTNGKVLVKAGLMNQSLTNASNAIEICIYDIDDDGNLSQRGKGGLDGILRFSPCSIPLKDNGTSFSAGFSSNRLTNNLTLDIGGITDSFWPIRQEIFSAVKSDFTDEIRSENIDNQPPFHAHFKSCGVEVLDLKVSDNGMCAISFRAISNYDFYYKDGPESSFTQTFTKRKDFNHITTSVLIFDIGDYLGAKATFAQNFNSEIDNYYHIVMPKEQNNQTKGIDSFYPSRRTSPFTASSLAFDYEDLYVNVQDGFFRERSYENVIKLAKDAKYDIFNVNTFTKISFHGAYLADAAHYNTYNNRRYIADATEGYNKAFFGGKIKIFKEYQSSKSIMLVGAMLLDPYVLQRLPRSHNLNPFGAVYIYKKDKDQDEWDYHGAVYGKGYTSENIAFNLSEFDTGVTSHAWNRRVGMFGYDFDYSDGVLFVSEPGGTSAPEYGNPTVSSANIYSFDISSAPTLIKTYNSSDISINSSSLATGDNVGTHIAAFGRQDVFGFSDVALEYIDRKQYSVFANGDWISYGSLRFKGESLIHNFRNNSSFGFDSSISGGLLEYSRENTLNELRPYFTSHLKTGAYPELDSVMQVWSRVLSIKKFSTNNKDRLLVVRKFAFRLNDYSRYSPNSFNVVKLQVIDLERDFNGPLFIKAANVENNAAPLFNLAPGPSGKFDLAIKPIDYSSGLTSLFLDNRITFDSMSLHTPHVDADGNVFLPLAMDAFAPSVDNQAKLFLKHQYDTAAPSLFMPVIGIENSDFSLAAQGSLGEGLSSNPTLVINKHIPGIPENAALGLFLNQKNFSAAPLFAAGGPSDPAVDLVIGTFAVASGISQVPLGIKTFIPPIGPGGGYIASGNIPIVMAGNNDAGVYYDKNNNAPLFLGANAMANSGNVLFIEKAYGAVSPLYIDSRISSGNITSFVGGTAIDNSGMSLITKVAETGNFNIFTRGFFD